MIIFKNLNFSIFCEINRDDWAPQQTYTAESKFSVRISALKLDDKSFPEQIKI